jgi:hypothetical protein
MGTCLPLSKAPSTKRWVALSSDGVRAANGHIKRLVYPPGFRWSTHLKPLVGMDLCMPAHVGFLARGTCRGRLHVRFHRATVVVMEPGHEAWVIGDEAAVLIQFDAEVATAQK